MSSMEIFQVCVVFKIAFLFVVLAHQKVQFRRRLGSGCRVKPRGLWGRRGFTTRELQTCTFQAPALQTPPNFNERTKREKKE